MNLTSWILLVAVVACFIAAVVRLVKNKGKCSCGCGSCKGCGKDCGKN